MPCGKGGFMETSVEKKFAVEIIYNGITKKLEVELEEKVAAVLQKAIAEFHITQNPHLLSLYRQDGSQVPENESVERAGLRPGETLLLRPNAVKGGAGLLRVAENIVVRTFHTLRECGGGRCECAAYWLGPAEDSIVDGVEHPVHERSAFGYVVDDRWLTDFWKRLAGSQRSVKAQVHTHPGSAFHSATDDQWPIVSQAGFLSIVIPNFAAGEPSLYAAWIGRLQTDGTWRRLTSAADAFIA
jgi:proteasome lid subunit RPN8/RPN11